MNYLYIAGGVVLVVLVVNRLGNGSSTEEQAQNYGKVSMTETGHPVRSRGEKKIADFLASARIDYIYEPIMHGLRPDFYLPQFDTIIEYFGMATLPNKDGRKYRKKMAVKMTVYRKKKQKVIPIFSYDLENSDYKRKIRAGLQQVS